MQKWHVVALLLLGLALLILSVVLRTRFGQRYDLKTIDLVLIIVPLLFALLITGRVKVFEAFGVKADFSDLFAKAASTNIERQVQASGSLDEEQAIHILNMAAKGGVSQITRLIEQKTEALVFRLGHGGYYGPAIKEYFDALYASSYLQYVILLNRDGTLFGIYDAANLTVYFRTQGEQAYDQFADRLNQTDERARRSLSELPGFIGAEHAVSKNLSKSHALKRMDKLQFESLPVTDENGHFIGTVERSQLLASLILEVSDRLGANKNVNE